MLSIGRHFSRACRPYPLRSARRRDRPVGAETLESRALLSATFALDAGRLRLDGFTAAADEDLTVREDGDSYQFVLAEGTWAGADGGGVTGAGTAVLAVDKTAVAGLAGGIDVDAFAVRADVTFETADFSTLAGGLDLRGAGTLTQAAGRSLSVSWIHAEATSVSLEGSVTAGAGNVTFVASRDLVTKGASITTTSGAITLSANQGPAAAEDESAGVLLQLAPATEVRTTLSSDSGAITIRGRAGGGVDHAGVQLGWSTVSTATGAITIAGDGGSGWNSGVFASGLAIVESTGAGAASIRFDGRGGATGGGGLYLSYGRVRSATGDIVVTGQATAPPAGYYGQPGVALRNDFGIESTGRGPDAATITMVGTGGATADGGSGIYLDQSLVASVDGDIRLDGRGYGSSHAGVEIEKAGLRSTGTGADAAAITVTGVISGADPRYPFAYGVSMDETLWRIETVDGDVSITGVVTEGRGTGVFLERGWLESTGTGPDAGGIRVTGTGGTAADHGVWLYFADVRTAGGDVTLDGRTGLLVEAGTLIESRGTGPSGGITLRGGPRGGAAEIEFGGRPTPGPYLRDTQILSFLGSVSFVGDQVTLDGKISTGGLASVAPRTAGRPIDLGEADSAAALGLSDAELDRVSAGTAQVGDAQAGDVRLVGQITRPGIPFDDTTLSLVTGGSVLDRTSGEQADVTADRLTARAAGGLGTQGDGDLDLAVGRLAADAGGGLFASNARSLTLGNLAAGRARVDVAGAVAVAGGATLDVGRLGAAGGSGPPLVIANDGSDPVAGTFAGLPEGAVVRTTDGRRLRITYQAGNGNDVALVAVPARDDLIGYHGGTWQVAASTGTAFESHAWSVWEDRPWNSLTQGDFDGDGRTDVLGLLGGLWQVGLARGAGASAHFATTLWGSWLGVGWQDATAGDLNGDGKDDVLARSGGGSWYAALSTGTAFAAPTLWATWHDAPWKAVALADLDGDGDDDLLANSVGQWHAGHSTGGGFRQRSLWSPWADLAWEKLGTFDADGDGRADVVGFYRGTWQVGRSTGAGFATSLMSRWADLAWKDPLTGDFDGDGKADVAARAGGLWQVTLATGATSVWEAWPDEDWRDVRAGDFDRDGKDDLVARRPGGNLRVAVSTGSAFVSGGWGRWADVPWKAVAAADATGRQVSPAAAPAFRAGLPASPSASASPAAGSSTDDEPLAAFWAASDEDETFVGGLVSVK